MRGRKSSLVVTLTETERRELERWQRSSKMRMGLVRRARALLLVADGKSLSQTAQVVGLTRKIVRRWVERFLKSGIAGLQDRPGRGRKPAFPPRSSAPPGQVGL